MDRGTVELAAALERSAQAQETLEARVTQLEEWHASIEELVFEVRTALATLCDGWAAMRRRPVIASLPGRLPDEE